MLPGGAPRAAWEHFQGWHCVFTRAGQCWHRGRATGAVWSHQSCSGSLTAPAQGRVCTCPWALLAALPPGSTAMNTGNLEQCPALMQLLPLCYTQHCKAFPPKLCPFLFSFSSLKIYAHSQMPSKEYFSSKNVVLALTLPSCIEFFGGSSTSRERMIDILHVVAQALV